MNESLAPKNRLAYSLDEAASLTGLSVSFLRLEIARQRLRPSRAGRRVLISAGELQNYLEPEKGPNERR
jgi:excisionase family DNA binding protein